MENGGGDAKGGGGTGSKSLSGPNAEASDDATKSWPPSLPPPPLPSGVQAGIAGIDLSAARAFLQQASQLQPAGRGGGYGVGLPIQPAQQPAGRPGGTVPGGNLALFGGVQDTNLPGMLGTAWGPASLLPASPGLMLERTDSSEAADSNMSQSKLSARTAAELYAFRPPRTGQASPRSPKQRACFPPTGTPHRTLPQAPRAMPCPDALAVGRSSSRCQRAVQRSGRSKPHGARRNGQIFCRTPPSHKAACKAFS